jgi:hypothetical protein
VNSTSPRIDSLPLMACEVVLTPRKQLAIVFTLFGLIMLFYVSAIFYTFRFRYSSRYFEELDAFIFTSVSGLAVFALGYVSVVVLGGKASLGLVGFISRFNGSRHAVEVEEETQVNSRGLIKDASLLYVPALIFMISLALALNIHYLHTTTDIAFLSSALNALDIFLKPSSIGSLRYSIEIIPIMFVIVAVAGVVPSIVFPYLRKFKVTSVNAAPFHRDILFNFVGGLFGITVVLSLVDIVYGTLTGSQPHYYDFVLPTMLGFSLHYFLGAYMGRKKAEESIEKILVTGSGKRVFQGKIIIQEQSINQKHR